MSNNMSKSGWTSSKHAFWQALVFTVFIFLIGLLLGVFLENSRADKVEIDSINSELNLLDEQLRQEVIGQFSLSCEDRKNSAFRFADKIYGEALRLERYDSSSKFKDSLEVLHKRYDLLRVLLLNEGIRFKEECGDDFHTVVYLFDYGAEDIDIESRQDFFGRLLIDLKGDHQDDILLIPIAGNLDLESVDLIKERYGVEELPVIIIDEEKVVRDILTFEELEGIVFG